MGRARVVAPPPENYIPEPLVAPQVVPDPEPTQQWIEGNLEEEIAVVDVQPSEEELVKERIAQEKYEELQRQKAQAEAEAKKREKSFKKTAKKDPALVAELEALRVENEKLAREKEAAEKAREETIVAMRNKATEQRGNQLNMVTQRKPSLWARLKARLKRKRIELATVGVKNYETAIIQRARIAVPKMLDDIEKMHEQLTILEELLAKHAERQKIKD